MALSNNLMQYINLTIAGQHIIIFGSELFDLFCYLDGFQTFITNDAEKDSFKIYFDQIVAVKKYDTLYHFDFDDIDCYFGSLDGKYYFTMMPRDKNIEPMIMEYNHGNEVLITKVANPTILRFALWMAFNILGLKKKMLAIHSSCVIYDKMAVLFLGESGTGKSTHTRLWYSNFPKCFLLNDDSPIISSEEGKIMVHGSPWSGKTPCYRQESYPLKAVVRLVQAPANELIKLSIIESVAALCPSFPPAFAFSDELSDKIFSFVSEIIREVPVLQLKCLPNLEAAELVRDYLYK